MNGGLCETADPGEFRQPEDAVARGQRVQDLRHLADDGLWMFLAITEATGAILQGLHVTGERISTEEDRPGVLKRDVAHEGVLGRHVGVSETAGEMVGVFGRLHA